VLALDAALSACSVAVLFEDEVVAHCRSDMARGQAAALLPMVREAMSAAGFSYESLDLVAVSIGPGHFTGLRIGLAAAQGLALAWELPLEGVTTLEAVAAAAAAEPYPLVAALETKREDLYVQTFLGGSGQGDPIALAPADAGQGPWPDGPLALAGDGAPRLALLLEPLGRRVNLIGPALPDAVEVGRLAARRHGTVAARAPRPLYLRPPDVTFPKASPH
jgi:tRNA threonylcarbamoyladenosine biosynthesis protein TsaB